MHLEQGGGGGVDERLSQVQSHSRPGTVEFRRMLGLGGK